MSLRGNLLTEKLPQHVAIIMDGNGRWAEQRGKARLFGHIAGVKALKEILNAAGKLGIRYLTVYAFSTENWGRPDGEVQGLMSIMSDAIDKELKSLNRANVRLNVIGKIEHEKLPEKVKRKILDAVVLTKDNTGITFNVAFNYGGRREIVDAVKQIAGDIKNDNITIDSIDETTLSSYLMTRNMPDPDLVIRTSGEIRISNFLLYQIAYSELYFTDILWPDFSEEAFYEALINYQNRERRKGKTSKQL